jgi:hypothetical protein
MNQINLPLSGSTKACTLCGETKPVTEFGKHPATRSGYQSQCKECQKIGQRSYYKKHADAAKRVAAAVAAAPEGATNVEMALIAQKALKEKS